MKHFGKILSVAFACAAMNTFAVPYWALVTTDGYDTDTGSKANVGLYSGYLCTANAAATLFGANTIDGVTSYISANYDTAMASLAASSDASSFSTVEYTAGQYGLSKYFGSALLGEYFAVVSYTDAATSTYAFRVFDSSATSDGTVAFDPDLSEGGTAGKWTKTIPEPTSGLLLLLGVAGLALRRRS